jgi:hypothetical protein
MKKYFSLAVTVWFASIALSLAATPDKDTMMAKEKEAWQAFKDKKADDFKKVVDKDYRGVYADGVVDLKAEMDAMRKWDMKSFTLSDYTAFSDEPDVIVTTYKCAVQGTVGGKDASGTFNCGTVWKLENNAWLAIFHTNIKAEGSAK